MGQAGALRLVDMHGTRCVTARLLSWDAECGRKAESFGGGSGAQMENPGGTSVPGSSIELGLRFGAAKDMVL